MQSFHDAGENGAAFRAGFVANSDDVIKNPALFHEIEHAFRLIS